MSSELPHIDVVVPIVRKDFILPMLRSLHACTPSSHTVIVIDQTQPDWEFSKKLWDLADIVVKPHKNMGFAQASNTGIRISAADYVAVANDDVEFIKGHDWLGGIFETFQRFPKAAAVNSQSPKEPGWGWAEPGYRYHVPKGWPSQEMNRLGEQDRELQRVFREARMKAHEMRQKQLVEPQSPHDYIQHEETRHLAELDARLDVYRADMLAVRAQLEPLVYRATMNAPGYVDMLTGDFNWAVVDGFPCWLPVFKRGRLLEFGLFDERFNAGGEDYDMMARAYQAGYRMLATSRSWAWHWWGQSKDEPDGLDAALPRARPPWNKLSTKGDPEQGLWHPDVDVWGKGCTRTDPEVKRFPL